MNIKELKVEFRYLMGNIACMSITSEKGKPINNDIDNEDAIKMFNALIGSRENSIIQENKKYKEVIDKANDYIRACCNMDSKYVNLHYDYAQNGMSEDQVDELLDILKEVE